MRFQDKSIIVTGAGSGIGRAAAILFAAEGGRVVAADRTEGADETAAMIAAAGGTARAIRMDAGSEGDVIATVDLAVAEHGGLDIFFANAGISGGIAGILDSTPELWSDVLRVNLIGPFLAIKHGAPRIVERGKGAPSVRELLRACIARGAQVAVCTLGADGALAVDARGDELHVPAEPVPSVVDTNGAGDGFMAGYLAAHLDGADVRTALAAGARQAARAIGTHQLCPSLERPVDLEPARPSEW